MPPSPIDNMCLTCKKVLVSQINSFLPHRKSFDSVVELDAIIQKMDPLLLKFMQNVLQCKHEKAAALCNTDSLRTHVRKVHQLIGWHYDSRLGMQLKDSVLHAYTCVSLSFPALYSGFIVATSKLQKIMRVRKKELDWRKKRRQRAKMQPLVHEVGSELDDYEREEH